MARGYGQYCPIAHALGVVGERWSLLLVRELLHGPLRYSDLADRLPGCSTNMLAARLRALEEAGVIERHTLPPPAAARIYRLTSHGEQLRPVMQALAAWGARSLGPPTPEFGPEPGWLVRALATTLVGAAPPGRFEFRIDDEVASLVDGRAVESPVDDPDVVVSGTTAGFYHLYVDGSWEAVEVTGDRDALERLLASAAFRQAPVPA